VKATARGRATLPYLAQCAGSKPPRRIPVWLARLLAGEMVVGMMTEGRGFSNAKAKRELGWQPQYPSWQEGFRKELIAVTGSSVMRRHGECAVVADQDSGERIFDWLDEQIPA
jgi:hypothetical protein